MRLAVFGALFGGVFNPSAVFIRHMENGLALVFLAFIGAFLPDTSAYFAGNLFGEHKLIEAVSPNKTVEGAIGAVVGAVVSFTIYGVIFTGC